jgi:hypothetical protein
MITIYLKSLSGDIQTLNFTQERAVTIYDLKFRLKKKGNITHIFKPEEDSKEDYDKNDENKEENKDLPDDFVVKDNDVLYLFYSREEFTKEELKKFENKVNSCIGFFPEFKEVIMKNRAIVAGGSVLSAFCDYKINDFDIYVNYSNAKNLLEDIMMLGFQCDDVNIAPAYDESFFRKNNIMSRFFMIPNGSLYDRQRLYLSQHTTIDIMVIPNSIPLENVVTNFDLTFCQVWWDGENIHSYDIDDIRSKSGSLNPDYINTYLDCNSFIINRIKKYKNRGFQIKIDISSIDQRIVKKQEKQFNNEEWSVKKVLQYIMKSFYRREVSIFGIDFHIQQNTLSSLYEILDKNIIDSFIVCFYNNHCVFLKERYRTAYREQFSYIIDNTSQQEAHEIYNEWIRIKKEEIRRNLRSLRERQREIFRQKGINSRPHYYRNPENPEN